MEFFCIPRVINTRNLFICDTDIKRKLRLPWPNYANCTRNWFFSRLCYLSEWIYLHRHINSQSQQKKPGFLCTRFPVAAYRGIAKRKKNPPPGRRYVLFLQHASPENLLWTPARQDINIYGLISSIWTTNSLNYNESGLRERARGDGRRAVFDLHPHFSPFLSGSFVFCRRSDVATSRDGCWPMNVWFVSWNKKIFLIREVSIFVEKRTSLFSLVLGLLSTSLG